MVNFEFYGLKGLVRVPQSLKEGEKLPVLLFLHGAGTRGNDLDLLLDNTFFQTTLKYKDFPFITIAPQCNKDSWFDHLHELKLLLKAITTDSRTDESRIYLMGNSMGGYGAWQLAMSCPEYFAAIVPICGGGMYWNAARLMYVPIWAHHGEKDPVVNVSESIKMVDAVNEKGGNARITIYEGVGHNAWGPTYENYEVFKWLLSNKNENPPLLTNENFKDSKLYG